MDPLSLFAAEAHSSPNDDNDDDNNNNNNDNNNNTNNTNTPKATLYDDLLSHQELAARRAARHAARHPSNPAAAEAAADGDQEDGEVGEEMSDELDEWRIARGRGYLGRSELCGWSGASSEEAAAGDVLVCVLVAVVCGVHEYRERLMLLDDDDASHHHHHQHYSHPVDTALHQVLVTRDVLDEGRVHVPRVLAQLADMHVVDAGKGKGVVDVLSEFVEVLEKTKGQMEYDVLVRLGKVDVLEERPVRKPVAELVVPVVQSRVCVQCSDGGGGGGGGGVDDDDDDDDNVAVAECSVCGTLCFECLETLHRDGVAGHRLSELTTSQSPSRYGLVVCLEEGDRRSLSEMLSSPHSSRYLPVGTRIVSPPPDLLWIFAVHQHWLWGEDKASVVPPAVLPDHFLDVSHWFNASVAATAQYRFTAMIGVVGETVVALAHETEDDLWFVHLNSRMLEIRTSTVMAFLQHDYDAIPAPWDRVLGGLSQHCLTLLYRRTDLPDRPSAPSLPPHAVERVERIEDLQNVQHRQRSAGKYARFLSLFEGLLPPSAAALCLDYAAQGAAQRELSKLLATLVEEDHSLPWH